MTLNRTATAVMLALLVMGIAVLVKSAAHMQLIEGDMVTRIAQAMIGVALVVFANAAPKQIGRPRASLAEEGRVQKARRIAGWSLTLAGLAYAVIWLAMPMAWATSASMAVVAIGLGIAIIYALGTCLPRNPRISP